MERRTLYTRNDNGRYEKVGVEHPVLPEGLHLVYVKSSEGARSSVSCMGIELDRVWVNAAIAISKGDLVDVIYKACQAQPTKKLTTDEALEWEEFKKTKAGRKVSEGIMRRSAAEISHEILNRIVK